MHDGCQDDGQPILPPDGYLQALHVPLEATLSLAAATVGHAW